MNDTRLTELTEAKVSKRAERDSHPRGSDEYRRLNIEWGELVEACAAAQTEPQPYVEDTTNLQAGYASAHEIGEPDKALASHDPDRPWYLVEGE